MKVMITLKVEKKLKLELQKLANDENRNLSNWLLNAALVYAQDHHNLQIDMRGNIKKKSK
jgi:hypothetical protein